MKRIYYQVMTETNYGTDDNPNIVRVLHPCEIECPDSNFEANLALAQREAYNGEVTVEETTD